MIPEENDVSVVTIDVDFFLSVAKGYLTNDKYKLLEEYILSSEDVYGSLIFDTYDIALFLKEQCNLSEKKIKSFLMDVGLPLCDVNEILRQIRRKSEEVY